MIKFKKTNLAELTGFFLSDLKLAYAGLGNSELNTLLTTKRYWPCDAQSKFLKIFDTVLGDLAVIKWENGPPETKSINIHFYLASRYQKRNILKKINKFLCKFCLKIKINTLYTMIPESCNHCIKAVKKLGFIESGKGVRPILWRNKYQDILEFSQNTLQGSK